MSAAVKPHPTLGAQKMASKAELNFMEFLQSFRRGELLADGDDKLNELMDAMSRCDGNGSMTIAFKFTRNKAGQLEVTPTISIKKPSRALGTGIYFSTDDGRLSRRDPNQLDIEDEIARQRGLEN